MNREEIFPSDNVQLKGNWDDIQPYGAYPPNFEAVQRYIENAKEISEQDILRIGRFFSQSALLLLRKCACSGPDVEAGRFGDLGLLPLSPMQFCDFCGYEAKPLWPRLPKEDQTGDKTMFKFGAFTAEFLFRTEKLLEFKASDVEGALKKIMSEAFGEKGCFAQTAELRFEACKLSYLFVLSGLDRWGQLAQEIKDVFPASALVFKSIVIPRARVLFEIQQTALKNELVAQSEHLRPSIYQCGVNQLSQQTVVIVSALLTTQLQIDYNAYKGAGEALSAGHVANLRVFIASCGVDELKLDQFFAPETEPYAFLALHKFEDSSLELAGALLENSQAQMEKIVGAQKEDIRVKYGQLARLVHAHFILHYFQRFLTEFRREDAQQLLAFIEQLIIQYAEEQLKYLLLWYRFVVDVQKMLETCDMTQIREDPRWNAGMFQVALTNLNNSNVAGYKAIHQRILKQMGTPCTHGHNIPLLIVKQAQVQLRASIMLQIINNTTMKYRRFVTFKDVDYNVAAQLIELDVLQAFIKEAFRE